MVNKARKNARFHNVVIAKTWEMFVPSWYNTLCLSESFNFIWQSILANQDLEKNQKNNSNTTTQTYEIENSTETKMKHKNKWAGMVRNTKM